LRSSPEFGPLLSAAKECQKKFLEERDRSKKWAVYSPAFTMTTFRLSWFFRLDEDFTAKNW